MWRRQVPLILAVAWCAVLFGVASIVYAKPAVQGGSAIVITNQQEYRTTQFSPEDCYGDDYGIVWQARGTLGAGETWTYTSPKGICWDHHAKVRAEFRSFTTTARVELVDYGLHSIPVRVTRQHGGAYFNGRTTDARACNTDAGYSHVYSDPEDRVVVSAVPPFEFSPRNPVTWQLVGGSSAVDVVIDGSITEPPSPVPTGGEGSWDWCLYPPP